MHGKVKRKRSNDHHDSEIEPRVHKGLRGGAAESVDEVDVACGFGQIVGDQNNSYAKQCLRGERACIVTQFINHPGKNERNDDMEKRHGAYEKVILLVEHVIGGIERMPAGQ